MCTSFVINKSKTLVGWNLDLNAMEHRVRTTAEGVYIEVADCFAVLKATAQTACPTVVSMVFDVTERTVHWCLDQQWEHIQSHSLA